MRHRKAGRKLGRNATHRLALMRNLTRCPRAARTHHHHGREGQGTAAIRREADHPGQEEHAARAASRHGPPWPPCQGELLRRQGNPIDDSTLKKLFKEIGPRFANRPGGYTRIIKRSERRLGDAGRTAFIELLKEGESKIRARPSAPAPRVTEPTPPTPSAPPAETPPPPPAPTPETSTEPQSPPSAPPQEQQPPTNP